MNCDQDLILLHWSGELDEAQSAEVQAQFMPDTVVHRLPVQFVFNGGDPRQQITTGSLDYLRSARLDRNPQRSQLYHHFLTFGGQR